jgi:hypothetical protein
MSLERKDVRFKLDPEVHADLADLCDVDGLDLAEFCERVVGEAVRSRVHAATVLAERVARRGKAGNFRERDPGPGESGRELPFAARR